MRSNVSRLSVMMFLQYAVWGAWLPLAARYLTAPVSDGGLGFTGTQMGLILGLDPLTQHDAGATPMYRCFTKSADLTPYKSLPARIDLDAKNGTMAYGARESAKMDWSEYDRIDEDTLNRILWRSIKGADAKVPPPVRSVWANAEEDEDERK